MSPEYQVNIPEEKATEFEEAIRNLGGKIKTPEEARDRFLNEFVFSTDTYRHRGTFVIPYHITKHHSLKTGDYLICKVTDIRVNGGKDSNVNQINEDLLARVTRNVNIAENEYLKEEEKEGVEARFTSQVDDWFPGFHGTATIRIKAKVEADGSIKGETKNK